MARRGCLLALLLAALHGTAWCSGEQPPAGGAVAAAAHAGCGHGHVLEAEQRLVTRSLYLKAVSRAKEGLRLPARAAGGGSTLASAPPPPAAPRLALDFQLGGFSGQPAAAAHISSTLMPTAVKVLQKQFQVTRPTVGPLQLPSGWGSSKCIEADVDPRLIAGKGPGLSADYVLYVTSAPCEPGTMAYAGVCAVGGPDSRPIMGSINLCPGSFEALPPKRQMETVIHELLHAFVFSPSLFPLFASGDPRRNITGPYGNVTAIASPAVLAAVRRLSGCASAAGAALEDEGERGSSGSHWEARLFQGELMLAAAPFAGRADKLPRMDLTAALLADSGWYIPRAGVMPPLDFGAGAGCAWLGSKARAWMATVPAQQLYCSAASQASKNGSATCTYDHQGVAECFKALGGGGGTGATGAVGAAGSASLAFLNGVAFPFALGGGANCLSSAMPTPEVWPSLGLWRGPTSLCFPVQKQLVDAGGHRFGGGAGCWDTSCDEGGRLYVTLHLPGGVSSLQRCPTGEMLDLAKALPRRFRSGLLACPDNEAVCRRAPDSCGPCVHGYCQAGACHCALEYVGADCSVHVADVPDMDAWFDARPRPRQQQQAAGVGGRSSSSGGGGGGGDLQQQAVAAAAAGGGDGFWAQAVGGGTLAAATAPLLSSVVGSNTYLQQLQLQQQQHPAAAGLMPAVPPAPSGDAPGGDAMAALLASLTSPPALQAAGGGVAATPPPTSPEQHQQQLLQQLRATGLGAGGAGAMAAGQRKQQQGAGVWSQA